MDLFSKDPEPTYPQVVMVDFRMRAKAHERPRVRPGEQNLLRVRG